MVFIDVRARSSRLRAQHLAAGGRCGQLVGAGGATGVPQALGSDHLTPNDLEAEDLMVPERSVRHKAPG